MSKYIDPVYATPPRSAPPEPMDVIASELRAIRHYFEELIYSQRSMQGVFADILVKQNEIVSRLTTDTRIAELKAAKWEQYAHSLETELEERDE